MAERLPSRGRCSVTLLQLSRPQRLRAAIRGAGWGIC